jgi:hypothetical protein
MFIAKTWTVLCTTYYGTSLGLPALPTRILKEEEIMMFLSVIKKKSSVSLHSPNISSLSLPPSCFHPLPELTVRQRDYFEVQAYKLLFRDGQ